MRKVLAAAGLVAALSLAHSLAAQEPPSGLETYAGVRTFLAAPYVPRCWENDVHPDIAVVGVPFDEGTWGWPGERYGPSAMRWASFDYLPHNLLDGWIYIATGKVILKGKHWIDCGDVEVSPTVPNLTNDRVTQAVQAILARHGFPLVLGGDHSMTYAVLRAFGEPLTLVHFDAHLDTWYGSAPGNLDHSSWVLRAAKLPAVKSIVQIGMRGLANDFEAIGNARKLGTQVITTEEIRQHGVAWAVSQLNVSGNIYITLDVDVLDPTVAPGTGTLEPGGLTFYQLDGLLAGVASKGRLVGMDVMEVNPMRDHSNRTAQTAVRLILDTLGVALH